MHARPITLWQITDTLDKITAAIIDNDGELTPELERHLDHYEESFLKKSEAVALRIRELEATATAAAGERDRLAKLARVNANAAKGLKRYVLNCMERTGQERIQTYRCRIWKQINSRPSFRWEGDTYEQIPAPYRRTKHFLDDDAVLAAWQAGDELPDGVVVERGHHLRIS